MTFTLEQESVLCGLTQGGMDDPPAFSGKPFLQDTRDQNVSMTVNRWAEGSAFWRTNARAETHGFVRATWPWGWHTSSRERSAAAVLGYLRLEASLGVTSSCLPHFPPRGPLLPEDWQGRGG